jgi:hypothetical protein
MLNDATLITATFINNVDQYIYIIIFNQHKYQFWYIYRYILKNHKNTLITTDKLSVILL